MNHSDIILLVSLYPRTVDEALASYEVTHAPTLATALLHFSNKHPMLVLIDGRLQNAWEICSRIREVENGDTTMIIALCDEPAVERAINAGADDCIIMPASDILIDNRVKMLMKLKKQTSQEAEQKYQNLFDSANDAIFISEIVTGKILDVNRRAKNWLGYTEAEMLEMTRFDLEVPLDDQSDSHKIIQAISSNGHLIFEQGYKTKEGTIIPTEVSSRFLIYEGKRTILNFVRDITRRKQIEAQEIAQRELAEALRETAAALNSTLDMDELIKRVLEHATRVFNATAATVMILTPSQQIEIVGYWGYKQQNLETLKEYGMWNLNNFANLLWMQQNKKPFCVNNTHENPDWVEIQGAEWIRSNLGAPIIIENEVIGFLSLEHHTPYKFDSKDAENLMAFANQASVALQNARYHEALQRANEELEQRIQEATAELVRANHNLKEQIIERQQIESRLDEERNLLRTLIDTMPDHVYVKDRESRFVTANHATIAYFGIKSVTEIIDKTDFDLFPLETASIFFQEEIAIFETGKPLIDEEHVLTTAEGEERIFLSTKIPLKNRIGHIVGLVGVNRDITELRRADKALEQERNLLRSVIDNIPDEVYYKDMDGHIVLGNKPYLERLMMRDISVNPIGATNYDYFDVETANAKEVAVLNLIHNIQEPITVELRASNPTEEREWLLATQVPLYGPSREPLGLVGITRNVTSLKRAEDRLEHVVSGAHCLLWSSSVKNIEDFYLQLSISSEHAVRNFLPLKMDVGQTYADALQNSILPEDWKHFLEESQDAIHHDKSNYDVEIRCRRADGSLRWLRKEIQVQKLGNNTFSLIGVCTDITARKQAEFTLRRANELLEQRVEERTTELRKSNEELRDQIRERQRAEQSEREQRMLAEALSAAAASLSESLELETVLDRILTYAERVVPPHEVSGIVLIEEDIYVRTFRYREWQEEKLKTHGSQTRYYLDSLPLLRHVYDSRQAIAIPDVQENPFWTPMEHTSSFRSYLCVPIQAEGRVIGFINMGSQYTEQFNADDAYRLQAFSNQAGIAIRNAQLFDATRRHADELNQRVKEATTELENERAQLQAILEAMTEGVIYYDGDGKVRYANHSFEVLTGHTSEEWETDVDLWKSISGNTDQTDTISENIFNQVLNHHLWRGQSKLKRGDEIIDIAVVTTAVLDPNESFSGAVTVMRDISAEKRLEEQKARFIATASHELRTPITNMKTRLYLLKRKPETLSVQLPVLETVTDRMRKLVDDLLDVSRFEHGVIKLTPESLILQSIVQRVVEIQTPEAQKKSQQLELSLPDHDLHLMADPERLTQVVTNLVTNAINYTPEGGSIHVTLQQEDHQAVLSVQDTGIGIPAHLIGEIFKPFFRVNDFNTGVGLGLSITKEIIELHHGEITVSSQEGEGTCFTVRLPLVE